MVTGKPLGQLFSDVYLDRSEPVTDSERFRVQLFAAFQTAVAKNYYYGFVERVRAVAGFDISKNYWSQSTEVSLEKCFLGCSVVDLLDLITHVTKFLTSQGLHRNTKAWIALVNTAIKTQNVAYEIDAEGGMHRKYDLAFAKSRQLTLSCLSESKFEAAHEEIEKAFDCLTQVQPDTKLAVVNVFLAAENLFKIVTNSNKNLTNSEVEKTLRPVIQRSYATASSSAQQSSGQLASSFASWVDACHPYRHGQKDVAITAPPIEIAITLVTAGADFIRWLAGLGLQPVK